MTNEQRREKKSNRQIRWPIWLFLPFQKTNLVYYLNEIFGFEIDCVCSSGEKKRMNSNQKKDPNYVKPMMMFFCMWSIEQELAINLVNRSSVQVSLILPNILFFRRLSLSLSLYLFLSLFLSAPISCCCN